MRTKRIGRGLLVVAVLASSLLGVGGTSSFAQPLGAELVEAVTAEAAGTEAYVRVSSVEHFDAGGGEAIFEPGTDYEERFHYDSVDAEAARLVGLTRPAPLSHPAGAFVEAASPQATAEPTPQPSGSGDTDAGDEGASDASATPSNNESSPSSDASTTDASSTSSETRDNGNVVDEVLDLVGVTLNDPCAGLGLECTIGLRDPCDPDATGQTCLQFVADRISEIMLSTGCDPYGTGQTCEQYVVNTLVALMPNATLFCEDYNREFVGPTENACVAFIRALNPDSPPQDCASEVAYSLICTAYSLLLVPGEDFEMSLPAVPAQPTEVAGVALPPPASGPGSNLDCSFWRRHRFYYKNGKGDIVGYGRIRVDWCGNDGTQRIRYWTPSFDAWVRWDWQPILDIYLGGHSDTCRNVGDEGFCSVQTELSNWEVWKGWCPYCQRRTPTMWVTGGYAGYSASEAEGY